MKSKIALFLFSLSAGISAAHAVSIPERICYREYDLCMNAPRMPSDECFSALETCLAG